MILGNLLKTRKFSSVQIRNPVVSCNWQDLIHFQELGLGKTRFDCFNKNANSSWVLKDIVCTSFKRRMKSWHEI